MLRQEIISHITKINIPKDNVFIHMNGHVACKTLSNSFPKNEVRIYEKLRDNGISEIILELIIQLD